MTTTFAKLVSLVVVGGALVVGCGGDDDPAPSASSTSSSTSSSSSSSGGATATTVQVTSNAFSPATVTIKKGQAVKWVWAGGTHNVVSGASCTSDGKFTSGAPVAGTTFERTFAEAGTFDYFCQPHCAMGMTGKVVVE